MGLDLIPADVRALYEVREWRHASAVLFQEFPNESTDIIAVLREFRLRKEYISVGGGRKSGVSLAIDGALYKRGWKEKQFDTKILIDGVPLASPTHSVDCFKGEVALEIEWNNKDPFFDRDLNNFRLLFDLRVISLGVFITRCDDLQEIFDALGRGASYGASTTHMSKLLPKINGGGGGGWPILVFGISKFVYTED